VNHAHEYPNGKVTGGAPSARDVRPPDGLQHGAPPHSRRQAGPELLTATQVGPNKVSAREDLDVKILTHLDEGVKYILAGVGGGAVYRSNL
jgi:hypothetical protein